MRHFSLVENRVPTYQSAVLVPVLKVTQGFSISKSTSSSVEVIFLRLIGMLVTMTSKESRKPISHPHALKSGQSSERSQSSEGPQRLDGSKVRISQ